MAKQNFYTYPSMEKQLKQWTVQYSADYFRLDSIGRTPAKRHLYACHLGAADAPKEWFYMQQKEITVREIADALQEEADLELEIWEAAGVLEVVIPEERSMDFEWTRAEFRDEYSKNWLTEQGVKTMFFVTIDAEHYTHAKHIMQTITGKIGGFFCGDTEDFQPVIK